MKQLAKIIVWIMAAPLLIILFVWAFPLGLLYLSTETDWLDEVPTEIIVIAAVAGEIAWICFAAPIAAKLIAGGS